VICDTPGFYDHDTWRCGLEDSFAESWIHCYRLLDRWWSHRVGVRRGDHRLRGGHRRSEHCFGMLLGDYAGPFIIISKA
jgi:hypothetical protein